LQTALPSFIQAASRSCTPSCCMKHQELRQGGSATPLFPIFSDGHLPEQCRPHPAPRDRIHGAGRFCGLPSAGQPFGSCTVIGPGLQAPPFETAWNGVLSSLGVDPSPCRRWFCRDTTYEYPEEDAPGIGIITPRKDVGNVSLPHCPSHAPELLWGMCPLGIRCLGLQCILF
jgi:hypothetical protein